MSVVSSLAFEASIAARSLADYVAGGSLRLGVTGLSRAGKTVFITSLVHHLLRGGRLPVFRAYAEGRLIGATLEPQPDDAVTRFAYESHLAALTGGTDGAQGRHWPESTRRISELRLTLDFERRKGWRRGPAQLVIDIVDYPGEWLLDLPLLAKDFRQWSQESLDMAETAARATFAAEWRGFLASIDPKAAASEDVARRAADGFTSYLRAARGEKAAQSSLAPGRFLMPGDLEGSPALTFSPLPPGDGPPVSGSLASMMERRYEAYKTHVVRPFFRDHFARLDRQIVLVDALAALNAGPAALRDLETALTDVLQAFRAGRNSLLSQIFRPRIDRILFAATKADHLHHASHDRLEAILRLLVARAINRTESSGVAIDVIALAAVRATHEARVTQGRETIDAIVGVPIAGEEVDGEIFDGQTDAAIFPGALPQDPATVFRPTTAGTASNFRFVRFRPPPVSYENGKPSPLPHIRLDRTLEFLLGDRLA